MVILWRDLNQRWQECDARNILQIMMRWVWSDSDKEWFSQKLTQNCSATQNWTLKVVTLRIITTSNIEFFTCFDAVLMTQLLLKILSAALLLSRLSQFSVWARGPRCHCSYQCLPRLNSNAAWSTQDQASPTDNLIILVSLPWCPDRPVRPVPCWVLSSPAEPGLPPPLPLKVTKLYAAAPS